MSVCTCLLVSLFICFAKNMRARTAYRHIERLRKEVSRSRVVRSSSVEFVCCVVVVGVLFHTRSQVRQEDPLNLSI